MNDEKSRRFIDWILSGKAPKAVSDGLKGLGEFGPLERAAQQLLGADSENALVSCRVILYFEERLKSDPGPTKSGAGNFVPIQQFADDFFSRHPEYVAFRPLLAYYIPKAGLSEAKIYVPPPHKPIPPAGTITGWFAAVTGKLGRSKQTAPAPAPAIATPKTESIIRLPHRAATVSNADRGKERVSDKGGCELIRITGGRFIMGAGEEEQGRQDNEFPRHEVTVKSFYMAKYPVTNEEYERFIKACGAKKPDQWSDPQFNRPRQPVVNVNWEEAQRFAAWAGGRLPSEAEWEFACRGGKATAFCSGDTEQQLARVGWYKANSAGRVHDVGEKEANNYGLYDMHGNIWEWCEDDWHGNYERAPKDGSAWVNPSRGSERVARGGAYSNPPAVCRAAFRFRAVAIGRTKVLGFRIAVPLIG